MLQYAAGLCPSIVYSTPVFHGVENSEYFNLAINKYVAICFLFYCIHVHMFIITKEFIQHIVHIATNMIRYLTYNIYSQLVIKCWLLLCGIL